MIESTIYTAKDLIKIKDELIKTRYEIQNSIDYINAKEGVSAERLKRLLPENMSSDYTLMISIIDTILDNPILR